MKCTNPQTSNGKKCDGNMTAPAWIEAGKVECEKCGYRTDAKGEAPKKPKNDAAKIAEAIKGIDLTDKETK